MPKVIVDENELDCLKLEHARFQLENEKLKSENDELKVQCEETAKDNENLSADWKSAVRKRDELELQVEDLQEKLDGSYYSKQNLAIVRLEKENNSLRDSFNEAVGNRNELQEKVDEMREYCENTESAHQSMSDCITELHEEVKALKKTNSNLAAIIEDLKNEKGFDELNMAAYANQLESQLKDLSEKLDGKKIELKLLSGVNLDIVAERDNFRNLKNEAYAKITSLELTIGKMHDEIERLEGELTKSQLTTAAVQDTLNRCQEKLKRHRAAMIHDMNTGKKTHLDNQLYNLLANIREEREAKNAE